jgi:hypothetical protein
MTDWPNGIPHLAPINRLVSRSRLALPEPQQRHILSAFR